MASDGPHASDDPGRRCLTVVLVIRDEQSDLEPIGVPIEQLGDPLPSGELSTIVFPLDLLRPAALTEPQRQGPIRFSELAQAVLMGDRLADRHSGVLSDHAVM